MCRRLNCESTPHPSPALKVLAATLGLLVCAILLSIATVSAGDEANPAPPDPDDAMVFNVEADRFSLNMETNETIASGHVSLTYDDMHLNADRIRYDRNNFQAWAEGNVTLVSGNDRFNGDRVILNLKTENGLLENGVVYMDENHIYIKADTIQKTGPATYTASRATLTPCDGPRPDWRITGQDLKITVEGYGYAKHAAFWARQVPLLYTPYLVFPVKTKRQSGLLFPEFNYSATRTGFRYLQPFFWAINPSSDATFYAEHVDLRGLRLGAEYRYLLGDDTSGTAIIDGFEDRQVDDGNGDSSENWGYTDDAYLRPNSDRYWLRAKVDQALGGGMHAKLDVDLVSDQDYLHEFREGGLGFKQSQSYFRNAFGRDLEDDNNLLRLNQLNLNKTWDRFSANADMRWYDNVVQRRQDLPQDTVQHLPGLSLNAITQPLGMFGIYYTLDAGYDHLYRVDGDRGQRAQLYTRLSYPMQWMGFLSVTPSAGWRQTFWHLDHRASDSPLGQNDYSHSLYDLKLNFHGDLFKVYPSAPDAPNSLKHIIRPELTYAYVSHNDAEKFPQFDALDLFEARNLITYALTNVWIRRSAATPTQPGDLPRPGSPLQIRFKIQQSFDIDKNSSGEPRPFSDILADLDIIKGPYVKVNADTQWSPYDNTFNTVNTGVHASNTRGDWLDLKYRFAKGSAPASDTRSIRLEGNWQASDHWRLRGIHERNLEADETIETGLGFSYLAQCWSVDVDMTEEVDDRSIAVMVHLLGL